MEYGNPLSTVGGVEGARCNYQTRLDVYGCGCFHWSVWMNGVNANPRDCCNLRMP